ncbi:hypothetical protein BDZ45DRAFT_284151 [Acephala macrosclerotiorum]|nr:hypothetical protein BDZ45DRAFT_284151 [Acephala macrosclerotiorum]
MTYSHRLSKKSTNTAAIQTLTLICRTCAKDHFCWISIHPSPPSIVVIVVIPAIPVLILILHESLAFTPIFRIFVKNCIRIPPMIPHAEVYIRLLLGPALVSDMMEYRFAVVVLSEENRVATFTDA